MKDTVFRMEMENRTFGENLEESGNSAQMVLENGVREQVFFYTDPGFPGVTLKRRVRKGEKSPFCRFRYELETDRPVKLTKREGKDNVIYGCWEFSCDTAEEVQLSHFKSTVHSFVPVSYSHEVSEPLEMPGPILILEEDGEAVLLAYEHGAQAPDSYLVFEQSREQGKQKIILRARKGNYYNGQVLDREHPFRSCWMETGRVKGGKEDLLKEYRRFFLKDISVNAESRKPYIFYNSWGMQERNAAWYNRPYLDKMNEETILQEIEAAHELGVDVFVIDTGWYEKTGDWEVSRERFPNGLQPVKEKLDSYGMKMGLWFNPVVAARSSRIYREHPEYVMSLDGKENWEEIWETESSTGMCLASGYSDYYIEAMKSLRENFGVTYFKWDAICQYGCNSPCHNHGTEDNSPQERADCYAYQMGMEMIRIVEEVTKAYPEVIVDFDITEGNRFVGLGFLAAGKYFLANNSVYTGDLGIPEEVGELQGRRTLYGYHKLTNIFLFPSAARNRFTRSAICFDHIVPSGLFLTHYYPDGPKEHQETSLASMALGGNGIWGNLQELSREERLYYGERVREYKKAAQAALESYPEQEGELSASPEIYAKLSDKDGEGIISFFTCKEGTFTYRTRKLSDPEKLEVLHADEWRALDDKRLEITVRLPEDGGRLVIVRKRQG